MKIFCIGFQKTGTTSMDVALTQLGYRVCGEEYDLIPCVKNRDFDCIGKMVEAYDAFQDNPWPLLYRELDLYYPESKFILTIRDEVSWLRSFLNHFGSRTTEMMELVYGYSTPTGHENAFLETYQRHNADVLQYFSSREKDFLVLDLQKEASWGPLCAFLEKPVPDVSFPHENKGAYTKSGKWKKWFVKRVRAKVRSLRNLNS